MIEDKDKLEQRKKYLREWQQTYRSTNREAYNKYVRDRRANKKEAYNEYQREYRRQNRERLQEQEKTRRTRDLDKDEVVISKMLNEARRRAKRFNIPFDLTADHITLPAVCPILQTPFTYPSKGDGHALDTAFSLDRVIPELGYTAGNVQVISNLANRLKNSNTKETLAALLAYLNAHSKSGGCHR